MEFVILLSILGVISGAPAGNYVYQSFPHTTTVAPYTTAPPVHYAPQPPAPPTYTKTYTTYSQNYHPVANFPAVKYYSANPIPTVTGNLFNFLDTQGQYKFGYSLSDGQAKTETKQVDGGVSGQYSYVDPEGKRVELSYVADKDGFRATGDHLPVAPSVPELPAELAQAYNEAYQRLYKAHEEARLRGETTFDDGSYKPEVTPATPSAPVYYYPYVATPVQHPTTYPIKHTVTYTAPALPVTYVTPAAPVPYVTPAAPVHYVTPAAPAPKPVYSSSEYNTNVGAPVYVQAPAAPAPVPVAPVTPAPYTKSAYVGNPY